MTTQQEFESYVILDTTKTNTTRRHYENRFESYVILDTTKTADTQIVTKQYSFSCYSSYFW